jgi:tetratricopeptide (TPR) repeat protein
MSPRGVPVTQAEQAQNELLAQLGLPPSASPDDVDRLHEAASEYLASAPPQLRGWAHAQVAALDAAYLELTDPVGLEGSALRSPTSPPAVVPGGPATPPVRRDLPTEEIPVAAAVAETGSTSAVEADAASPEDVAASIDGEPDAEELAALYASVTPSAHADMAPSAKRPTKKDRREVRKAAAVTKAASADSTTPAANPWKRLYIATFAIVGIAVVGFFGVNLLSSLQSTGTPVNGATGGEALASPGVNAARVSQLMTKLQENPQDVETLLALADEYFLVEDYATAGTWLDKVIEMQPDHERATLARGAVYFNTGDLVNAEATWTAFAEKFPDNQEVHYDLGFLYLNQAEPDWAAVQREWERVIEIDPSTTLAESVKSHLDSLANSSMMPGASSNPAASPAASGAPVTSGAPESSPELSPAGIVLELSAQNLQFSTPDLAAPANKPFTIHFANFDPGVQHDVVINGPSGTPVFTGALIDGGKSTDYAIPPLAPGTYTFTCSIHPNMTGTLTVGS